IPAKNDGGGTSGRLVAKSEAVKSHAPNTSASTANKAQKRRRRIAVPPVSGRPSRAAAGPRNGSRQHRAASRVKRAGRSRSGILCAQDGRARSLGALLQCSSLQRATPPRAGRRE